LSTGTLLRGARIVDNRPFTAAAWAGGSRLRFAPDGRVS
jgi:hypothetical protein